jgi:sterol 3beta-glucosyltransferase
VDSESTTTSIEPGTESSAAIQSMDESNASASQILDRSDVFRAPAARSLMLASDQASPHVRYSHDTSRSSGVERQKQRQNPERLLRGNITANLPPGAPEGDDDAFSGQDSPRLSGSSSALQDIASYPLHKASGLAGFLRTRSKKMSSLLATESMGYYEKVSGMLAGGRKHYATAEGLEPDDQIHGLEDDEDATKAAENFREHFAFPETEILQSSFFASLQRVLPNYGKIYVSTRYFCFRSLMPTSKTKVEVLMPHPNATAD